MFYVRGIIESAMLTLFVAVSVANLWGPIPLWVVLSLGLTTGPILAGAWFWWVERRNDHKT